MTRTTGSSPLAPTWTPVKGYRRRSQPGYGFLAYGYDDPDKLRIVIWPLADGPVPGSTPIYDNRRPAGFDIDIAEPQAITGGNVQLHV